MVVPVLLALTGAVSGCAGGGAYDVPLPGGADVGDHPVTLTVEFEDVLDLVPHSSVQLEHVAVGSVRDIALTEDGSAAEVTLEIRDGLDLPADTTARIQQTSLLGEKYVALVPGTAPAELADGARIGTAMTSRAVGSEDVLGALSALLNGGGVAQFQEISREFQAIGSGRTGELRTFLRDTEAMLGALDNNRQGMASAIDGIDALSQRLAENRDKLRTILDDLGPGVAELAGQRKEFTKLLAAMDRLSKVTVRTLDQAGDDMVADLQLLDPVLDGLADSGNNLPVSLEMLLTFPFTDAMLTAVRGDYINTFLKMDLAVRGSRLLQPEEGR